MKKQVITAALLGFTAVAGAAQAASGEGWYGGLRLGRSVERLGGGALDSAFGNQGLASSSALDGHETSGSLFAGYKLNQHFALEGGYVDLGRFGYSSAVSAPAADTVSGHFGARGVEAAAVGIIPIARDWSVYGKAGLAYLDAKLDAGSTGAVPVSSTHHRGTDPLLGAGLDYSLTQNVSLRAEWDRYFNVGDTSTGKGDIDQYTVGVVYHFQ